MGLLVHFTSPAPGGWRCYLTDPHEGTVGLMSCYSPSWPLGLTSNSPSASVGEHVIQCFKKLNWRLIWHDLSGGAFFTLLMDFIFPCPCTIIFNKGGVTFYNGLHTGLPLRTYEFQNSPLVYLFNIVWRIIWQVVVSWAVWWLQW